jgi:U3 small nucleolar RNA-associated protein 11
MPQKIEKLQNSLGFLDEVGPTKLAERHTIFVSDEEEAEEFDAEEFFNTPKELLTRAYNRPTKDMIENDVIIINKDKVTKKDLLDIEKAKASSYKVRTLYCIAIESNSLSYNIFFVITSR